jgi:uncharacterized protein (TIGR03435 family)
MRTLLLFLLLSNLCLSAQTGPHFEIVSIRQAPPDDGRNVVSIQGGPGTKDPTTILLRNVTVLWLLNAAYAIKYPWQLVTPDGLEERRFDITAKVPEGTAKQAVPAMYEAMLAERFAVSAHHETREHKSFNLVVARGGPKLRASSQEPEADGDDGFPKLNGPGMSTAFSTGANGAPVARMTAKAQPISALTVPLSRELQAVVADKTGLIGTYDFKIEYTPYVMESASDAPSLVAAVRALGLTLTATRTMQDIVVIDHLNKTPTEN